MTNIVFNYKSVFFSWTHYDEELKNIFVDSLRETLGVKYTVWESQFDCHGNISDVCFDHIAHCAVFVVLVTDNAITKSGWVSKEIEHATKTHDNSYMVPIYWSGDYNNVAPFNKFIVEEQSAVVNDKHLDKPDKATLRLLCDKVANAINQHAVHSYYNSETFTNNAVLDYVQSARSGYHSTACTLDDIWVERKINLLDKKGDIINKEQPSDKKELLEDNPILLIGDGGSGKSWLFRRLIQDILPQSDTNIDKLVFEVKLVEFAEYYQKENLGNDALLMFLYQKFVDSANTFGYNINMFQSLLTKFNGNIYIFFDGIDEMVSNELAKKVFSAINSFYTRYGACVSQAYFSSRNYYDINNVSQALHADKDTVRCYRLSRLDDDDRDALADKLFSYIGEDGLKDDFLQAMG